MSTTTEAPPVSAAETLRRAAAFHDAYNDLIVGIDLVTVVYPGRISAQIPMHGTPARERRTALLMVARLLGGTPITEQLYRLPETADWGSLHTQGTWLGVDIDVWTALSRPQARALGLATCPTCSHRDHDDDTACLAAMTDPDGTDRTCACGAPADTPAELDAVAYDDEAAERRAEAAWDDHVDADAAMDAR